MITDAVCIMSKKTVCLTATLEVEFQLHFMKLYEQEHYNMYYNCYCIHSVVVYYSARRKTRILKQRSIVIMRCSFKLILYIPTPRFCLPK